MIAVSGGGAYTVPINSGLNRLLPLFVFFLLAIIFHIFLLYVYDKYPLIDPSITSRSLNELNKTPRIPDLIVHMTSKSNPSKDRSPVSSVLELAPIGKAPHLFDKSPQESADVSQQTIKSANILPGLKPPKHDLRINWEQINKFDRVNKNIHSAFLVPSKSQDSLVSSRNRTKNGLASYHMPNDSSLLLKVSQWGLTQCFEVREPADPFNDLTQDAWFYTSCGSN